MLTLRRATPDDCKMYWEWANAPSVRKASFSSDPIPWSRHVEWFTSTLRNPNCELLVAADATGQPIGQIRFEVAKPDEAKVGVSIAEAFRGRGYGVALIEQGVAAFLAARPVRVVHAYIKETNQASVRAFEKAGFERHGVELVQGERAAHYIFLVAHADKGRGESADGNEDVAKIRH